MPKGKDSKRRPLELTDMLPATQGWTGKSEISKIIST
jgi:hypothetical protein